MGEPAIETAETKLMKSYPEKHLFITIRYSVLSINGASSWLIGRGTYDEYRARLFDAERLAKRYDFFSKITLPSLVAQEIPGDLKTFHVYLLVSTELPAAERKLLDDLIEPHKKFISIVEQAPDSVRLWEGFGQGIKNIAPGSLYGTARLDDDDAVAPYFAKEASHYLDAKYANHCVSFPSGYGIEVADNRIVKLWDFYYAKHSAGLMHVQTKPHPTSEYQFSNIFGLGSHTRVDEKVPTILDAKRKMFVRTFHDGMDSEDLHKLRQSRGHKRQKLKEILEQFLVCDSLYK